MSIDTIANATSILKNASMAGKSEVELPYSRIVEDIMKIFKTNNIVEEVKVFKEKETIGKKLNISLKKSEFGKIRRLEVKRVSKPGRRIYSSHESFRPVRAGLGVMVVSTPRGVMEAQEAKKRKLGGEILCIAW
jgi:small subunit ribosomal protein S8